MNVVPFPRRGADERAEMLRRALDVCPDVESFPCVIEHLSWCGVCLYDVADIFDAALDAARARAKILESVQ